MPTYELTFVLDPRLSDEETQALCDEYKQMIEAAGGRVEHRDDWGKRQLAYPIGKLEEGRYFLWHLSSDDGNPTREAEHRMRQKEEVLRFLTVRTEKLDFDAAAAEEAKATDQEPAREEAPAKEVVTAEPPAPQAAPEAEEETAPAAPSEAESGAVEAAAAEEEAAVGEAPSAGDAAADEGEIPSEEEAR